MNRRVLVFPALFLCGCVTSPDFDLAGLRNIAALSRQQKEAIRYCKIQEDGFRRLEADIGRGAVQPGMSWESVRAIYGEPVAVVPFQPVAAQPQMLVYRRPCDFFDLPIIYMNFGPDGNLTSWSILDK